MSYRIEGIERDGRTVYAVDPTGCGCNECITGEYVPLEEATVELLKGIALGTVANNTYGALTVTVRTWNTSDPIEAGDIVYQVELEHLSGVWSQDQLDGRDADTIVRESMP